MIRRGKPPPDLVLKYEFTAILLKSLFVIWQMIPFFIEAPLPHY